MSRTLMTSLMTAVAILACVYVWSGATQLLHAEKPALAAAFAADVSEILDETTEEPESFDPFTPVKRSDVRSEYQELMRRRSERLSEEELAEEVERLQTELTEQDAAADEALVKVTEELRRLLVDYRGTPAAEKAAAALQAMQGTTDAKGRFKQLRPQPTY